jgi:hypothetical protein
MKKKNNPNSLDNTKGKGNIQRNLVKKHMDILHKPRTFLDKTKVIPRKSKYYSSEFTSEVVRKVVSGDES